MISKIYARRYGEWGLITGVELDGQKSTAFAEKQLTELPFEPWTGIIAACETFNCELKIESEYDGKAAQ